MLILFSIFFIFAIAVSGLGFTKLTAGAAGIAKLFSVSLVCHLMGCTQPNYVKPAAKFSNARVIKSETKGSDACTESDKKIAIHPDNKKFASEMDHCASGSMGNAEKTAKCLAAAYPGLSAPCATCFGEMAHCASKHCKSACLFNHTGKSCVSCSEKHCDESGQNPDFNLSACTGVPKALRP